MLKSAQHLAAVGGRNASRDFSFLFPLTLVALPTYKGLTMLRLYGVCVCVCVKGLELTGEQWLYNVSRLSGQNGTWGSEGTDRPGGADLLI